MNSTSLTREPGEPEARQRRRLRVGLAGFLAMGGALVAVPAMADSASDSQTVTADVGAGSVSITAPGTKALGTLTPGTRTSSISLGSLAYTNTLDAGTDWSVTVTATDLVNTDDVVKVIPFSGIALTPGSVSQTGYGTVGSPSAGSVGTFSGTDTTPGTTASSAVTVAAGNGGERGSWSQGSNVTVIVPATLGDTSGYSGTLEYTITG